MPHPRPHLFAEEAYTVSETWQQVRRLYFTLTCSSYRDFSYAAPTGDESLTPDDAVNVLEEILEAENKSFVLGLKLKLPLHVVDAIHSTNLQPRNHLLQVLIEFTKQVDPRPTWRAILFALRSPAVNLPQLAMRVEAAHFSDPTASREAPPPGATNPTGKITITTKGL